MCATALSGSRSIIMFQGTYNASNDYELPAGTTAVIYFDGAGSGAVAANVFNNAHFDALNVVGNVTVGGDVTVTGTVDAGTVEFDNLSGTGAVSVTNILDEDNMASDSATALSTQQSIKAYVDAQVGAFDSLAEVLAVGNTTGGTDLLVSTGDDITFADGSKAIFGDDNDLQIYHDGSNSRIQDTATGSLILSGTNFYVNNTGDSKSYIAGLAGGTTPYVRLYYDGSTRLDTTLTGIDVTGTVTATGTSVFASLDISGDIDVDGTTNLDVVDIDGAVNMATTALVTGVLTTTAATVFNGGFASNAASTITGAGSSAALLSMADTAGRSLSLASPADATEAELQTTSNHDLYITAGDSATNRLILRTDGTGERLRLSSSEAVFNEGSADTDFRVESDSDANMLFVDAGNSRVGIGTGSPQTTLQVNTVNPQTNAIVSARANGNAIEWGHNNTTSGYYGVLGTLVNNGTPFIGFSTNANSGSGNTFDTDGFVGSVIRGTTGGALLFEQVPLADADDQTASERMQITGSAIILNDESRDQDFRVESNSVANMFFVDAGGDYVGIGTSADFGQPLNVNGGIGLATDPSVTWTSNYLRFQTRSASVPVIELLASASGSYAPRLDIMNGAGTVQHRIDAGGNTTFNETGADTDFRVESLNNDHMLFVDAGGDYVSVGTAGNLNGKLNVAGSIVATNVQTVDPDALGAGHVALGQIADGSGWGAVGVGWKGTGAGDTAAIGYAGETLYFAMGDGTNADSFATVFKLSRNEIVVNEDSNDIDFRVESDGNQYMLFVDGENSRVTVGGTGTDFSGSDFVVQGRSTFKPGSTTEGQNIIVDGYGAATDDNILVIGTQRSSGGPFIGYGLGQNGTDAYWSATYDNFSGAHSVLVLNGATLEFYNDASNSLTAVGDEVTTYQRMAVGRTDTVFNGANTDTDFRVASDTVTDAFTVDGASGSVSVNGSAFRVGNHTGSFNQDGTYISNSSGSFMYMERSGAGNAVMYIHRRTADGVLVEFYSQNAIEGDISVSGTTVSYNGFCGTHDSSGSGVSINTPVGTVLSTIDEEHKSDHAKVKVSDSVGDKRVYGVLQQYKETTTSDDTGHTQLEHAVVASVGIASVRVTGACEGGDLLESNGDGTAKVQSDDIVRSKTLGKVTIGNSDTGVKLVSCVMYCG
jgi:hypothetical protein